LPKWKQIAVRMTVRDRTPLKKTNHRGHRSTQRDWVYAVNKFAEPSVRIQTDRGQKVVDTGPYAIVRHPLYASAGVLVTGMPLALGSFWALIPVGFGAVILIVRTVLEDRMLQNQLEGYKGYAARVRYKVIPGVW
jgi:protein-S-isoprenylcysteine O-methyltransferase Ste14